MIEACAVGTRDAIDEKRENLRGRSIQRVSLVVAAFNERGNIQNIIDSIASQKVPEGVEISMVVSDNGSDDTETLKEYDRLLRVEQPVSLTIVQGSKSGYLGAAREYGIKAAIDLFNNAHPNVGKSHVIVGLDADGPIDSKNNFFTALVDCFEKNPDAALAYGPLPFATTKHGTFNWTKPIGRPIFKTFFLKRHFGRNGRAGMMDEFVNKPQELFHGGCQIFTQAAYEELVKEFGSAYSMRDSTAEEATFSLRAQNAFNSNQVVYDKRIVVPFSLREIEGESGRVHYGKAARKAASLVFSGSEHFSYRLVTLLEAKSPEERAEFIEELGNLSYRSAVNAFIRGQEEKMFGLSKNEHVKRYINTRKAKRLGELGYDIRDGVSQVTGHTLHALVDHAPETLNLSSNEYVAFYVNSLHARYLQRFEYAVIKTFIDPESNNKIYAVIGRKPSVEPVNYTIFEAKQTHQELGIPLKV